MDIIENKKLTQELRIKLYENMSKLINETLNKELTLDQKLERLDAAMEVFNSVNRCMRI